MNIKYTEVFISRLYIAAGIIKLLSSDEFCARMLKLNIRTTDEPIATQACLTGVTEAGIKIVISKQVVIVI
jgi:hypothetical protein